MYVSRFGSHGDQRPVSRRLKIRAAVDTGGERMSQAPHRLRLRLFAELIAWLAIIFRQKTRRRGGQLQCAPDRRARINARDPRRKGVETVNRDPSPGMAAHPGKHRHVGDRIRLARQPVATVQARVQDFKQTPGFGGEALEGALAGLLLMRREAAKEMFNFLLALFIPINK